MWTWGSIKPGNTMRPAASITSAPGGASRFAPIRVMVSFSIQISPFERESALTISALRISSPMEPLMNLNPHFLTVRFHRFPVFGHLWLGLHELIPGDRFASRRQFHHLNAVLHGADVIAEPATHAVLFAHARLRPGGHSFRAPVGPDVPRIRRDHCARWIDQIDALMGRVIARDVAQVALDALRSIDARYGPEGKIEIFKIGNSAEAATAKVFNGAKAF